MTAALFKDLEGIGKSEQNLSKHDEDAPHLLC